MDINGFRDAQSPWFFTQPSEYLVETRVKAAAKSNKQTQPTPDNRYPGWAAPMEDGRLSTDYRPHCEANMPTGTQYATRQFMQKNADSIIQLSRSRQAMGRSVSYKDVPAKQYVSCDTYECRVTPAYEDGVGTERIESVPELFGTFANATLFSKTISLGEAISGKKSTPKLTKNYEGGRNTPGRFRGNV